MTEDQKQNQKLRRESRKAKRTPEQDRAALRRKVRIFYDLQRLRIQTAGRTLDRATEIELHEIDIAILEQRAKDLSRAEKEALRDVETHLKTMPAFTQILADKEQYKGVGPTMAGVLLSEIDIKRANTPSALWRYAGLATVPCRRCKVCKDPVVAIDGRSNAGGPYKHQFNRQTKCIAGKEIPEGKTYASSQAERGQKGTKLPFNRFFKTKVVGVLADCLIKSNSPWRKFYDDYKHRLVSADKGRDDGHRHMMAKRYMVKMFLLELWTRWRELEGLEVRPPYAEEYLDKKHHDKVG